MKARTCAKPSNMVTTPMPTAMTPNGIMKGANTTHQARPGYIHLRTSIDTKTAHEM